jgi:hypothetical protein
MTISEKVTRWWELADRWGVQVGVSQSLILAVMHQESGGNPEAKRYEPAYEKKYILDNPERMGLCAKLGISARDAATSWGLMQMMFFTAYGYNARSIKQLIDPNSNVRFGVAHLGAMIKTYGSKEAGLAAYNGGGGGAADYTAGRDTQAVRYSRNVMALYALYRDAALLKQPDKQPVKEIPAKNYFQPGEFVFQPGEFVCKCGCGTNKVKQPLIDTLNVIRERLGVPVVVTSGTRCAKHNKAVGGVANSNHLSGEAADIQAKGVSPDEVRGVIRELWSAGKLPELAGLGSYKTFTHADIAPKVAGRLRTWNG